MDLSRLNKYKQKREELAGLKPEREITDYCEHDLDLKELHGTLCDPDEALLVTIYSKRTKKMRNQLLKRRNIIGRACLYRGSDNIPGRAGKILGFYTETGGMVLCTKDTMPPHADNPDIVIIEE